MRIDEFAAPTNDSLPFDVADDVAIFMRNDPMFYRKQLFPAIMNMKDRHDAGKAASASLRPSSTFSSISSLNALYSYFSQFGNTINCS